MPTDYVEDYEEITGLKREKPASKVTAKVVTAPKETAADTTEAEVK